MLRLLLLISALAHEHSGEFRAGWQTAKARADLWDRYEHGQIDRATLRKEQMKHLTPQEKAELLEIGRAWMAGRAAEREAKLQEIRRIRERWNAPGQVGPPPPPKDEE